MLSFLSFPSPPSLSIPCLRAYWLSYNWTHGRRRGNHHYHLSHGHAPGSISTRSPNRSILEWQVGKGYNILAKDGLVVLIPSPTQSSNRNTYSRPVTQQTHKQPARMAGGGVSPFSAGQPLIVPDLSILIRVEPAFPALHVAANIMQSSVCRPLPTGCCSDRCCSVHP